jgi:hypothetical protein
MAERRPRTAAFFGFQLESGHSAFGHFPPPGCFAPMSVAKTRSVASPIRTSTHSSFSKRVTVRTLASIFEVSSGPAPQHEARFARRRDAGLASPLRSVPAAEEISTDGVKPRRSAFASRVLLAPHRPGQRQGDGKRLQLLRGALRGRLSRLLKPSGAVGLESER